MEEGQIFDPKFELVTTKCAELLGESIPGENCRALTAKNAQQINSLFASLAQAASCKYMFY
jgi:hypothetical protein